MNILLINPIGRIVAPANFFPIGLGYIASVLRNKHNITVLDIDAYRYSDKKVIEKLKGLLPNSDIVMTGGLTAAYKYIKWMNSEIKKIKDIKIVVGGHVATHSPELVLKNLHCDIVVLGEGERTAEELISKLDKNKSIKDVKGIWYKNKKTIIKNPMRERIMNLDELPFPAWDLFPMNIYLKHSLGGTSEIGMNIITNRGCIYNCNFCAGLFKDKVVCRSLGNVIKEIKFLKEKYGVKYFKIVDELTSIDFVHKFCDYLIKEKMNIQWRTIFRANLIADFIDDELLQKMKKSGCLCIYFGAESMCQRILDNMNKGITVEQIVKSVELLRRNDMPFEASFMIGYPGEDKESIEETVKKRIECNLPGNEFNFTTPYPGSTLYDWAMKKGLIKDEDAYIDALSIANYDLRHKKPLVNLTDMSDEELMDLHKKARKELGKTQNSFPKRVRNYLKTRKFNLNLIKELFRIAYYKIKVALFIKK